MVDRGSRMEVHAGVKTGRPIVSLFVCMCLLSGFPAYADVQGRSHVRAGSSRAAVSLRLRGGSAGWSGRGGAGDEEITDDNIRQHLNDSHFEYEAGSGMGGPGFRTKLGDELTVSALDVIRLRFVPRDVLSNSVAHQSFRAYPPLYAHQLFGQDE